MVAEEITQLDKTGEAALYQAMRHFWQPAMYARDLGDEPVRVVLMEEQLVITRLGDEICAFTDLCIHRGTALSLGRVEGDQLRCAYHGWTFGPDGVCTSIPARFGTNIPIKARVKKYKTAEACGLIWVCLEDEPKHPLPEFPEFDDPDYRIITTDPYEWNVSFARRVENYVDFAHFAWVHDGVLGDSSRPEVPDHEVWREGAELRMKIAMAEPTKNPRNVGLEVSVEEILTNKNYRMFIPNGIWVQHRMTEDERYVLFMACCPVNEKRTRTFTYLVRNYDFDVDDQKYLDYHNLVLSQDVPVVESQRPEELPVDLSAELHIRGVDQVSMEYRKWLIEIAQTIGWEEQPDGS